MISNPAFVVNYRNNRWQIITEIDCLLTEPETEETNAEIDRLAERLTCLELRTMKRKPCGKHR